MRFKAINMEYTGININLLRPQMWTKMGIDYEFTAELPLPGVVHPVKHTPQKAYASNSDEFEFIDGNVDIGYE
jgi:hypothetical protein